MKKSDPNALLCEVTRLLPVPVLVLDENLCVHYLNQQAQELLNEQFALKMPQRCGDVLQCLHALQPHACCGQTEECPQCLIRQLVIRACREEGTFTERARISRSGDISRSGGADRYTEVLVRVSSLRLDGQALATVMLQDIPELGEATGLVRLCAWCHKVGQGEQWVELGDYLESDLSLKVTHGMCSECADRWKQEHDQDR